MDYYIYLVFVLTTTLILGVYISTTLKKLKLEQTIREDGPKTHLKKMGTPSMGGLIFLIPITLMSFFYLPVSSVPLIAMVGYGLIGIYDDLDKRVIKKSGGLSIRKKLLFEIVIGIIVGIMAYMLLKSDVVGFSNRVSFELNPVIYVAFIIIYIIAVTNGMNFTDGLDGLAILTTIPVLVLFVFISLIQKNVAMAQFCGLVLVSLIGFLYFNKYPAKIFMGDTGSLALGALVAGIAIVLKVELLLIVFGFIYFLESLSVVLQIAYFKFTRGKRLFRMAPIHHHFELMGWPETKVVSVFTMVSAIMSFIAYLIYIFI